MPGLAGLVMSFTSPIVVLGGVLAEPVGVQITYVIACLPVVVGAVAVWRSPARGLVAPGSSLAGGGR